MLTTRVKQVRSSRTRITRRRIRIRTTAPSYASEGIIKTYVNLAHIAKNNLIKNALVLKRKMSEKKQTMKRYGNLYNKIISLDNLYIADSKARRRKEGSFGVRKHNENKDQNLQDLHRILKNREFKTSKYDVFTIKEPKEREIYRLPYFPDRIVHHAIMNILEDIFVSVFTADTYSCIKGRGTHLCAKKVYKSMRIDPEGTVYCLKFDIKKFYLSIDHEILKTLLRKKIKDKDLLHLLDEIIDSAPGVPIGNYLSQYFANFYLSYFDHWVKEELKIKHYFRYADDIVIFGADKPYLHSKLAKIRTYLNDNLNLRIKENYQVFPVAARGVDFVGYVIFHTHMLLRKSIKKDFARAVKAGKSINSIMSYRGWAIHCDSKHLLKKLGI